MARTPRVLGVDDNPRNLAILKKAVGPEFDLSTAESGEAALELAKRTRPDIVLLDIMMPGIDGYETCRRLRDMPEMSNAKIILVSAKALASERLAGYDAGADDYVVKPFDPDELLAKLRVYSRLKSVEEVDRLRSDLLALLGHETRTPLTSILTPLPLLLMAENLTSEQMDLVNMVESGATRMLRLIERGCLLAQIRSGTFPTQPSTFGLEQFASSAVRQVTPKAAGRRVEFASDPAVSLPIHADPHLLGMALDALLDNALRHTPEGGSVSVHAHMDGGWAGLSVTDTGPGVPAELRPRLFDGFTVASVKFHHQGHGLGLALSRAIAELNGGRLWLDEQSGPGACFRMELPLSRAERAAA